MCFIGNGFINLISCFDILNYYPNVLGILKNVRNCAILLYLFNKDDYK